MIRLWPQSLAGRLSLIVVAAVITAQVAALAILTSETSRVRRAAGRTQVVDKVATLVRIIQSVPPESVNNVVTAFGTPRRDFSLGAKSLVSTDSMGAEEERLSRILNRRMKGLAVDARIVLIDRDSDDDDDDNRPRRLRRPQALRVSVKLSDGRWLNGKVPLRLPAARGTNLLFAILAASILAILLAVMIAVRKTTRPLTALAAAAERVGRGESVEPLDLSGPSEVRSVIDAFNSMQQRLTRHVADRTRLLAAISHDLRTPITALRLRAEMVEDEHLRASMVRTLSDMQAMAEATLTFARDGSGLEKTRTVDLVALIDASAEDLAALGHHITLDAPNQLPYRCRPTSLRRAFGNLLENAGRYGDRAHVHIGLADNGGVHVIIEDEGPGLPEDKLLDVFEPFVRLENSRSVETAGIGMGLAIARSIVRAHGGDIILANRNDGGLRAEVHLPSATADKTISDCRH